MVLAHSFYCSNGDCDNEVDHSDDMCPDCIDTISENSHHCCGCGEDMFISTNGYCGTCWTEKFSDDEDETLTHEPMSWYNGASHYCKDCDQWYAYMKDSGYQHCPDCRTYGHIKCNECGCPEQNDVLLLDDVDGEPICDRCMNEREIDKLKDRVVYINEKLATNMTAAQTADWEQLLANTRWKMSGLLEV